jgi:hypothetical protein
VTGEQPPEPTAEFTAEIGATAPGPKSWPDVAHVLAGGVSLAGVILAIGYAWQIAHGG